MIYYKIVLGFFKTMKLMIEVSKFFMNVEKKNNFKKFFRKMASRTKINSN